MLKKIEALGARFVEIPMNKNRSKSEGGPEISKGSLRAVQKREKPDVVLGYTSKPVIYGSIAAKKGRRSAQGRHDNGARLRVYRAD